MAGLGTAGGRPSAERKRLLQAPAHLVAQLGPPDAASELIAEAEGLERGARILSAAAPAGRVTASATIAASAMRTARPILAAMAPILGPVACAGRVVGGRRGLSHEPGAGCESR
jgi:hypothetical protein